MTDTAPSPLPRLNIKLGRAYKGISACRDRFVACEGPRGTAKTRSILTLKVLKAMKWPGTRLAVARSKRTALTETVLNTLEHQVFPALKMDIPGGANRENRSSYHLADPDTGQPTGSIIVPIGLDNPEQRQKLFSSEWTDIYVAEAGECGQEAIEMLAPTLRHYPRPTPKGERPYVQCVLDHNPLAPAHWLYKKTEPIMKGLRHAVNGFVTRDEYEQIQEHNMRPSADPRRSWKRVITKHMDNPGYWDKDKWEYTELGREYLQTLDLLTGFARRRMLDGEPTAAEGAVYGADFSEANVCEPFNIPRTWPCFITKDPGRNHRDVTLVGCLSPSNHLFIVAEVITGNASPGRVPSTVAEDARTLDGLKRSFDIRWLKGDPHMMFSATKFAQNGETIAQQFAKLGHQFTPAPAAANQAQIAQQVELVRTRLKTILSDGTPALQVFRTCTCTIEGFQSWSYETTASGEMTGGEDRFEDVGDDEMDCVRMMVASNPSYAVQGITSMSYHPEDDDE